MVGIRNVLPLPVGPTFDWVLISSKMFVESSMMDVTVDDVIAIPLRNAAISDAIK